MLKSRTSKVLFVLAAGALLASVAANRNSAKEEEGQVIVVTVRLPADAVLKIDDYPIQATGGVRIFQTPALPLGGSYVYTMKALSQGKEVTRTIHLAHNVDNTFDLRAEFLAAAKAKVHPKNFTPSATQTGAAAQDGGAAKSDEAAIEQSAQAFMKAYERGDAAAVASLWALQGELHEPGGDVIQGRANIAKAFQALFKEQPKGKVEVLIESIRFPAPNVAIEEGLLRQAGDGKELPSTTLYSTTHVKVGGQWQIALAREWGAGQDRLEDLAWLVGKWRASVGDQEVTLSFAKEEKKPSLVGRFTKKAKGKDTFAGTMKIAVDPQRGQLRSWHFDDDGGQGQALWLRDGNNWVLDSIGILADGTETASVNMLGRINNDTLTWRSIDRVIGDEELPDTVPIRLVRVMDK